MKLQTIYNISLNESAFADATPDRYASVFNKMDIYGRNMRFINEGRNIPNNILFTLTEQNDIKEMLSYIEYHLINEYTNGEFNKFLYESNGIFDKGAEMLKNIGNFIKSLPAKIRAAVEFIEKIIKSGISKVKDFIVAIGNILAKLGSTIKEAVLSFGIFNDSKFVNNAPSVFTGNYAKLLENDKTSNAAISWITAFVLAKANSKEAMKVLLESEIGYQKSATDTLDRWALSHKDSWLEKSKSNTLFRLFLSGTNASGERMGFFKCLIISIIGSFIFCTIVPAVISSAAGLATTSGVLILACRALWTIKNVARIIINRTLTYKNDFVLKGKGDKQRIQHTRLFDPRTILCIILALLTPVLFTIFHDQICDWLHGLFHKDIDIPPEIVKEKDPEVIERTITKIIHEKPTIINNVIDGGNHDIPAVEPAVEPVVEPAEDIIQTQIEDTVSTPEPLPEIVKPEIVAEVTPVEPEAMDVNVEQPLVVLKPLPVEHYPRQVTVVNARTPIVHMGRACPPIIREFLPVHPRAETVVNVYNTMSHHVPMDNHNVIIHDHGHPTEMFRQVEHAHGRVVTHDNHTYGVRFGSTLHDHIHQTAFGGRSGASNRVLGAQRHFNGLGQARPANIHSGGRGFSGGHGGNHGGGHGRGR